MPWVLKIALEIKNKKIIFIATQGDKIIMPREQIMQRWLEWTGVDGAPLVFTSSRTSEGLDSVLNQLTEHLPEGPLYYDVDTFTPQTMRELTAEIVRKQCFERLHQEIPYGLAILIREFEEGAEINKILADVIVAKDSHKGMVIGQGGESLKFIGMHARRELEKLFDKKVFLKLHVVVKPWIDNKMLMEELGYAN
jgi:GTP-binding protein Era